MNSFPIDRIIASFETQLSPEEQTGLEDWLSASEENRNQYDELRKIVRIGNSVNVGFQPDERRALQKVTRRILIKRIVRRTQLSAAAVFLTFFVAKAILSVVPNLNMHEITATNRQVIYLPDSTKVVLAEHANFKYPEKFNGDERVVFLKGQAYFEVTPDSKHPFKIAMPNTRIMVLGTKFFVDASNPATETVSVDEGNVFFYTRNFDLANSVSVKANETGDWNSKGDSIIKYKTPDPNLYSELSGKLIFRNAILVDVVKDLGKFYSVKIQLEGNYFSQMRFSANVNLDDGIDKILEMLTLVAPLSIEKSGNSYLLKLKDEKDGVWADPQLYRK